MTNEACFGCQTRAGARLVRVTVDSGATDTVAQRVVRLCRYCREGGEFDWEPMADEGQATDDQRWEVVPSVNAPDGQ